MQNIMGKCKYCGFEQVVFATDQQDANTKVSQNCNCKGAEIETRKSLMENQLSELAGEMAPNSGFAPVSPEVYREIEAIAMRVVTGEIRSASLKVDGTSISFTNSNGKIKAVRRKTVEQGGNIE